MSIRSKKIELYRLFGYISLVVGVFVALFPLYVTVLAAFKTDKELVSVPPYVFPKSFLNLNNFIDVFHKSKLLLGFYNIGTIIVISGIGYIIFGTMAAYAIQRFDFKLKKLILGAYALSVIIPQITTQVSTFRVIHAIGLYNTRFAMVILTLGVDIIAINIYLQFLKNIPIELDESAKVEGASLFKIYRSIIIPMLTPAINTLLIIKIIGLYNDLYLPYLYMPSPKLPVISTALIRYTFGIAPSFTTKCAAVLIIVLPSVAIYVFLQKYIFEGIAAGAVKG